MTFHESACVCAHVLVNICVHACVCVHLGGCVYVCVCGMCGVCVSNCVCVWMCVYVCLGLSFEPDPNLEMC